MKRLLLTATALAATTVFAVGAASAASIAQPAPGTVLYGPIIAAPPAGTVAPPAPAGYHNQWVYSYDHHGYRAHWEAVRDE